MIEKENKLIELGYKIIKRKTASDHKYIYEVFQLRRLYLKGTSNRSMKAAMVDALNQLNDDGTFR